MYPFTQQVLHPDQYGPLVITPPPDDPDPIESLQPYVTKLKEELLKRGALLLRGFAITDVSVFDRVITMLSADRLSYMFRSTPRTFKGPGIFTATEYPPQQEIPLHSENAYQREWPLKIVFCCVTPADSGGETPIANLRRVTAAICPAIVARFESRGVQYVRHYRPHFDLPWQTVFQTQDPQKVARFCAEQGVEHQWLDGDTLRTMHVAQGVAHHPVTRERVIFNQAHLFHVSSLGPDNEQAMVNLFGRDRLPRHACYGDGGEIPREDLEAVRAAMRAEACVFRWQRGDVLLLDNMQFAHGRRTFTGERVVLASMLDAYRPQWGSPAR